MPEENKSRSLTIPWVLVKAFMEKREGEMQAACFDTGDAMIAFADVMKTPSEHSWLGAMVAKVEAAKTVANATMAQALILGESARAIETLAALIFEASNQTELKDA